jgi:hypothetical protein
MDCMASKLRTVALIATGFALGFAVVASTVAAIALAVIGVGGHLLAQTDRGYARVISFDPSTVASHARYLALLAFGLAVIFLVIARQLHPST